MEYYNNELYHFGVKGMKWGVRKKYNEQYTLDRRMQDKATYGRGGVKRINKRLNKGYGIRGARTEESNRIYKARRRAVVAGQAGSGLGGLAGGIGGYLLQKHLTKKWNINDPYIQSSVMAAVTVGSAKAGSILGRHAGRSIGMLSGGYSPSKFRYT